MGGYSGSPAVTLKNNKDLLGKKKKLTRKDYIGTKEVQTEDHIKASPKLLNEIRIKIQREDRKRKKMSILIAVISLIITIIMIYAISNIKWIGIKVLT